MRAERLLQGIARGVMACWLSWAVFLWLAAMLILGAEARSGASGGGGRKAAVSQECVSESEAVRQPNSELCVNIHVYDVVELKDGTRFLDVCPAQVADADCRFVIVSLSEDRDEVGPLTQYRDSDVHLRGIMRPMHGRMGMVLSHSRQFSGGPERFKPNPKLARGFNGQSDRMPVHDPNLKSSGHHRSFMNTMEKEQLPGAKH